MSNLSYRTAGDYLIPELGTSDLPVMFTERIPRELLDEVSELPKKLTLNKLALIGEAEKSP